MSPKVGLLVIGTNKYFNHAIECITSFKKCWDQSSILIPYLFCNYMSDRSLPLHIIPEGLGPLLLEIPHAPWPLITLLRYHYFLQYQQYLSKCDYLLFVNANARANGLLGQEFLTDLAVVEHPGFYNRHSVTFPYEQNLKSSVFMSGKLEFPHYVQGFLQGGKTEIFLDLCEKAKGLIDADLYNNHIPIWHDESVLNYLVQQIKPTKLLDSGYAYPESWDLPFEKKIISLDKNHQEIRK